MTDLEALVVSNLEMLATLQALHNLGGDRWEPMTRHLLAETIAGAIIALAPYDQEVCAHGPRKVAEWRAQMTAH